MAVPMASSAKTAAFGGFKCRVASFRVVAWHFVAFQASKVVLRGRRKLLRCFQKMSRIFRSKRSTVETSIVISHGRRSASDVSCCVFVANRIVRAGSSGYNMHISWQAWNFATHAAD